MLCYTISDIINLFIKDVSLTNSRIRTTLSYKIGRITLLKL